MAANFDPLPGTTRLRLAIDQLDTKRLGIEPWFRTLFRRQYRPDGLVAHAEVGGKLAERRGFGASVNRRIVVSREPRRSRARIGRTTGRADRPARRRQTDQNDTSTRGACVRP
jgi:hypothetical protein